MLNSLQAFKLLYRSGARNNVSAACYSNPGVDELIDTLDTAEATYARDALIEQIWQTVLDDIGYVPLFHVKWARAMRDETRPADRSLPLSLPVFRLRACAATMAGPPGRRRPQRRARREISPLRLRTRETSPRAARRRPLVRDVDHDAAVLAVHGVGMMPRQAAVGALKRPSGFGEAGHAPGGKQRDTDHHDQDREQPAARALQGDVAEAGGGQRGDRKVESIGIAVDVGIGADLVSCTTALMIRMKTSRSTTLRTVGPACV